MVEISPFKSKAQWRFLKWRHPEIWERWRKEFPGQRYERLPERATSAVHPAFLRPDKDANTETETFENIPRDEFDRLIRLRYWNRGVISFIDYDRDCYGLWHLNGVHIATWYRDDEQGKIFGWIFHRTTAIHPWRVQKRSKPGEWFEDVTLLRRGDLVEMKEFDVPIEESTSWFTVVDRVGWRAATTDSFGKRIPAGYVLYGSMGPDMIAMDAGTAIMYYNKYPNGRNTKIAGPRSLRGLKFRLVQTDFGRSAVHPRWLGLVPRQEGWRIGDMFVFSTAWGRDEYGIIFKITSHYLIAWFSTEKKAIEWYYKYIRGEDVNNITPSFESETSIIGEQFKYLGHVHSRPYGAAIHPWQLQEGPGRGIYFHHGYIELVNMSQVLIYYETEWTKDPSVAHELFRDEKELFIDLFKPDIAYQNMVQVRPGHVTIYDADGNEILRWVEEEWTEDPKVVYGIANAISTLFEEGPHVLKRMVDWKPYAAPGEWNDFPDEPLTQKYVPRPPEPITRYKCLDCGLHFNKFGKFGDNRCRGCGSGQLRAWDKYGKFWAAEDSAIHPWFIEKEPVIYAEVHTDDGSLSVEFDAEEWFRTVEDDEVIALAANGWGHSYEADGVAYFFRDNIGRIGNVMDYCARRQEAGEDMGFECDIDKNDAMAWLKKNRPNVYERLSYGPLLAAIHPLHLPPREDWSCSGWAWLRPDLYARGTGAYIDGRPKYGYLSKYPIKYRWVDETTDRPSVDGTRFQVFWEGEWRNAESIDWEFWWPKGWPKAPDEEPALGERTAIHPWQLFPEFEYEVIKVNALKKSRKAYTATITDSGFGLGMAYFDEPGYEPLPGITYSTYEEAMAAADKKNSEEFGLTDKESMIIIASTMAAQHRRDAELGLSDEDKEEAMRYLTRKIKEEWYIVDDPEDIWRLLDLDGLGRGELSDALDRIDFWLERTEMEEIHSKRRRRCGKCKKDVVPGLDNECPTCGDILSGAWKK